MIEQSRMNQIERNNQKFKNKQKASSTKRLKTSSYPKELTIVAEGDSWFDYSYKKDTIDYLRVMGYGIRNHAKAGDTLENMVYGTKYSKFGKGQIKNDGMQSLNQVLTSINNLKPDFFLLSAGGNDIVGDEIVGYLNHARSNTSDHVKVDVFQSKITSMMSTIEFYIKRIHAKHNNINIIMDGYDYAIPNGKGFSFLNIKGPWILPAMGLKAIEQRTDQVAIIKYFVDGFNEGLLQLSKRYRYFHYLNLRGNFPNENEWDNEIHLKAKGYKSIANLYHKKISEICKLDPIIKYQSQIIT